MLELDLFRNRGFAGANTVMLLIGLAMFGVFFYVSLYVQQVLGYSPTQAGASFLPWTVLIILLAPLAGRLSDRIGPRPFVGGGMIVLGRLAPVLRPARRPTRPSGTCCPAMLLGGIGMSAAMAPVTAAAMSSVRAGQGGRRLGRPEQRAPGRRLARDRDHGRDRRRRRDELRELGAAPARSVRQRASTTRSRPPPCIALVGAADRLHDARRTRGTAEAARRCADRHRGRMSATGKPRLPASERRAARARLRVPRLLRGELPRHHDRRARP